MNYNLYLNIKNHINIKTSIFESIITNKKTTKQIIRNKKQSTETNKTQNTFKIYERTTNNRNRKWNGGI